MTYDETTQAWAALGGKAELAANVTYEPTSGTLPAKLPVRELARATVGACSLAAAVKPATGERHPLVETPRTTGASRGLKPAALPAEGIRVLDLTRVIAGPVATRTLAFLGADVLRIDPPALPEHASTFADTGLGKRSALLDLDHDTLDDLLAKADVVVTGYRPGALDRHGLAPGALLERHPGLVVAQLCAWGWTGPWSAKRGFDSLVQARNGIALIEGSADEPGVLPAQALDHGTGYLLAAAVLRALTEGGGWHVRMSLAGTASWLLNDLSPADQVGPPYGRLRHARSPVHYAGAPTAWRRPPSRWGADRPQW